MNKFLLAFIILASLSFASDYCVFDAQGNCVKRFEERYSPKSLNKENGYKKYYIALQTNKRGAERQTYNQMQFNKTKGRKRWYEVDWNQGVKLCPEKTLIRAMDLGL